MPSPNDTLQIATIGFGGMGQSDTQSATGLPNVKLVAASDVFDSRLVHAKEVYGADVFTTRDYREVLAKPEVDAVIIATPDHWHATITKDALKAGKHVYCEKPMVQKIEEGKGVIEAQKASNRVLQIGSQYASSIAFLRARDMLAQGAIGELNLVEAWLNRNSSIGAWQYSIPPDASPANLDWDRFLGNAPKRPFEPVRFFRWRNYDDYGTGVAGDLYVHLLTGLHLVTQSLGPTRVCAMGGLRQWKDGRDVPDVMVGLMDYPKTDKHPAFTFSLKVNFASGDPGEGFGVRFTGSEGSMTATMTSLLVARHPRETEPGFTIETFANATQDQIKKEYYKQYPKQQVMADSMRSDRDEKFVQPAGFSSHKEHHRVFQEAVRAGKNSTYEDGVFGLRTAGPALLANHSYSKQKPIGWDPVNMRVL